jgi:hypothetical protein
VPLVGNSIGGPGRKKSLRAEHTGSSAR